MVALGIAQSFSESEGLTDIRTPNHATAFKLSPADFCHYPAFYLFRIFLKGWFVSQQSRESLNGKGCQGEWDMISSKDQQIRAMLGEVQEQQHHLQRLDTPVDKAGLKIHCWSNGFNVWFSLDLSCFWCPTFFVIVSFFFGIPSSSMWIRGIDQSLRVGHVGTWKVSWKCLSLKPPIPQLWSYFCRTRCGWAVLGCGLKRFSYSKGSSKGWSRPHQTRMVFMCFNQLF